MALRCGDRCRPASSTLSDSDRVSNEPFAGFGTSSPKRSASTRESCVSGAALSRTSLYWTAVITLLREKPERFRS